MAKKYLDVRYEDRELAKRLGAKWDPAIRRWYCPSGSPLAKIFQWRAQTPQTVQASQTAAPSLTVDQSGVHEKDGISAHYKRMVKTGSMPQAHQSQPLAMSENFELFWAS